MWLLDRQTDTHTQTDAGQSDPYVPPCFAGNTINNTQSIEYIVRGTHNLPAIAVRAKCDYQRSSMWLPERHTQKHTSDKVIPISPSAKCRINKTTHMNVWPWLPLYILISQQLMNSYVFYLKTNKKLHNNNFTYNLKRLYLTFLHLRRPHVAV